MIFLYDDNDIQILFKTKNLCGVNFLLWGVNFLLWGGKLGGFGGLHAMGVYWGGGLKWGVVSELCHGQTCWIKFHWTLITGLLYYDALHLPLMTGCFLRWQSKKGWKFKKSEIR